MSWPWALLSIIVDGLVGVNAKDTRVDAVDVRVVAVEARVAANVCGQ